MLKLESRESVVGCLPGPPLRAVYLELWHVDDEWIVRTEPVIGWVVIQSEGDASRRSHVTAKALVVRGTGVSAIAPDDGPPTALVAVVPFDQAPSAEDFEDAAEQVLEEQEREERA